MDNDDYYEVTNEIVIKNTGKPIFDMPVYMKTEGVPESRDYIMVGV